MVYTIRFFFFFCSLIHNSNMFGSCIIHCYIQDVLKLKKNNSGAKRLKWCTVAYLWKIHNFRQFNCCLELKIKYGDRAKSSAAYERRWWLRQTGGHAREMEYRDRWQTFLHITYIYIYILFVGHQLQTWRLCETSRLRLDTPNLTYVYYKICTWALGYSIKQQ
jgi:hypothetical protein